MEKSKPQYSHGIEYIQLSKLPYYQAMSFGEWLPLTSYILVTENEQTVNDCVHYEEYEYWFDSFFVVHQKNSLEFDSII